MAFAGAAADAVLLLHLGFIGFVTLGGFLVLRWPRLAWLHLPCMLWGVLVEVAGWTCPLTPLEVYFRQLAGQAGYGGGFIEQYLVPLIYPAGLTRTTQIILGSALLLLNLAIYAALFYRLGRNRASR